MLHELTGRFAEVLRTFESAWVVVTALLAAMLLASHQLSHGTPFGLAGNYAYWISRTLVEAATFMAAMFFVERFLGKWLPLWGVIAAAIGLSLIPFALTITAFDLVVGLPELGLNGGASPQGSTASAFAYELVYLFDNHLVFCLMLLLPRFFRQYFVPDMPVAPEMPGALSNGLRGPHVIPVEVPNMFLKSLEPPLSGDLYSVEAQEHYVNVVSSAESRLLLYRFSDAVRHLPESLGMQVHRSHWVAHLAVKASVMQGQTMKLELNDGRFIPVSRTFRNTVELRYPLLTV